MPKRGRGKLPTRSVFDLIPTDSEGRVDTEKLALIERVLGCERQELEKRERERRKKPVRKIVSHLGDVMHSGPKITPDEDALRRKKAQKEKEIQEKDIYLNAYRNYLEDKRRKESEVRRAAVAKASKPSKPEDSKEENKKRSQLLSSGDQVPPESKQQINLASDRKISVSSPWKSTSSKLKRSIGQSSQVSDSEPEKLRERQSNYLQHFHQKTKISKVRTNTRRPQVSSGEKKYSQEKGFQVQSNSEKQKFSGAGFSQLADQKRKNLLSQQLKASTLKFNKQFSFEQEPPYLVKITPDKLPAQQKNYQETSDVYEGVLADAPWLKEDHDKKNTHWQESQVFDFEKPLLVGEVETDNRPRIIPLEERDGYWQDFLGRDFSEKKEREIDRKIAEEGVFMADLGQSKKPKETKELIEGNREGLKMEEIDYQLNKGELVENPEFEDKVSQLVKFLGNQGEESQEKETSENIKKKKRTDKRRKKAEEKSLRRKQKKEDKLVLKSAAKNSRLRKESPKKKKDLNSGATSSEKKRTGDGVFERKSWLGIFKPALGFAGASLAILGTISLGIWASYGFQFQEDVKVKGSQVINHLEEAKSALEKQDFASVDQNFQQALGEFEQMQTDLDKMGGDTLDFFSRLPYLSKVGSGKAVIEVGNELTEAGQEISQMIAILVELEDLKSEEGNSEVSLLTYYSRTWEHVKKVKQSLEEANNYAQRVKLEDLPEEYRSKFAKIKEILPGFLAIAEELERNHQIFLELLGDNGPRKYMLVFQNNQEMRATGGFIGSYGILSVSNGEIKDFFIEGIFGPDWQLKEDVIPPKPIQKISAGWSTHDANWFPHFPKSAEKIAWFYEKTGGPTIDGVIAITPNVMEKLLKITGPIRMDEYDITIDADNFIEKTQYEVEVDYDKEENKPKKILADLAPVVLEKIFATRDLERVAEVADTMSSALEERHIIFYSTNPEVQIVIAQQGWAGEVLQTDKDYLMVVNSNINGYKTDGVIEEKIYHAVEVEADGSLVGTTKVERIHHGGNTDYEWWNKVNANYMRVYVPQGSELLEASGHTREVVEDPLNYEVLEFKTDPDVVAQESSMTRDEETGTRIYQENGKTVFANWVYVSPQETVEVEYKYKLPFKLDFRENEEGVASYSLLAQKQSGSEGSQLIFELEYPGDKKVTWQHPQEMDASSRLVEWEGVLDTDQFVGVILERE